MLKGVRSGIGRKSHLSSVQYGRPKARKEYAVARQRMCVQRRAPPDGSLHSLCNARYHNRSTLLSPHFFPASVFKLTLTRRVQVFHAIASFPPRIPIILHVTI